MPKLHRDYPVPVRLRISDETDAKLTRLQAQTEHSRSDLSRYLYEASSIYTFPTAWIFRKGFTVVDNPLTSQRSALLLHINQLISQLNEMHRTLLQPQGNPQAKVIHLCDLLAQHSATLDALRQLTHALLP